MINIKDGEIRIPLEEFWQYVAKYHPDFREGEISYGVPKVDRHDIIILFSVGSESHPQDWAEKPKSVTEWDKK